VAERTIEANGVELCTEPFGDPDDPPILLVMGVGASMLWWEDGFCGMLAERGRFVIRYDHRDTGRSVTYAPGHPPYTGADLVADAAGVLDAYGIRAAHVVGVSAGGAFAQLLALGFPDRVLSLTLISTSPARTIAAELPPPTERFRRFVATAEVEWSDGRSVVDYVVAYSRVLAGHERPFDEEAARELVGRDVDRALDIAASENHGLIGDGDVSRAPVSAIAVPTLVIHGTADPMFPPEHGRALAAEIPGAGLLLLEGAGHGVVRRDWGAIVQAVVDHTQGGVMSANPGLPQPDPALARFDRFVGRWSMEGNLVGSEEKNIKGETTFHWLPGGFFLEQHVMLDFMGMQIDSTELIGYDAETGTFPSTVYSNLAPAPLPYRWEVDGDEVKISVSYGPLDATFTGSWREDGTFEGGWRPNPGADETVNVAYDIGGRRLD
jgi:pimeloyl-ACP methyl ester carboxylesterase